MKIFYNKTKAIVAAFFVFLFFVIPGCASRSDKAEYKKNDRKKFEDYKVPASYSPKRSVIWHHINY